MSTAKPTAPLRWLATALILLAVAAPVGAAEFVHGPYSCAPSSDSVVISWLTEDVVPARIEFDLRDVYHVSQSFSQTVDVAPFEPDPLHETTHATLKGLEPSANYVYRVVLIQTDSEVVSPVGAFSTAANPGEPVDFVVFADTQQQVDEQQEPDAINRLALVDAGIAGDPTNFNFMLHGGDVVESPSSYYWDDWFDSFAATLRRTAFIPVLGNHEKNHRSYYDAFELPPGAGKEDERWWALHWGDVVVVGLDTNVTKANEFREQQAWAREHLSGPEPHKFVIFHHPVFTSDAFHTSGMFLDQIYHPIFVEMNVDIVFNGHSHHYEHIVRDGVTYMVVGGGGATPRVTRPEHIQGSDVSVEGRYFYTRVNTYPGGIHVETIAVGRENADGTCAEVTELLDAFTLGEKQGAPAASWISWVAVAAAVALAIAAILILRR